MKLSGQRVVRGSIDLGLTDSAEVRINVFDGDYTTGYKVTKFLIITKDPDNSGTDVFGTLGFEAGIGSQWNLEDSNQFGWSSMENAGGATGPTAQPFSQVDRTNLIIEEFYIYAEQNAPGGSINYYIEMDKYDLEPFEGTLAMVENRKQG